MKLLTLLLFALVLSTLPGCSNSDNINYGFGNYRIDMATIAENTEGRYYLLDNQVKLTPSSTINTDLKTGIRVLVNYYIKSEVDTNSFQVGVNAVAQVNTSQIKALTGTVSDDPLHIESIWQTGDWLNMNISFEYMSKKHSLELLQRTTIANDTIYLELRHAKNGDTPGYWVRTYCSYSLKSFAKAGKTVPIKVRVRDEKQGIQYFRFDYVD